jgi:hypothetical protein
MKAKTSKTVGRSFRINEQFLEALTQEAENEGISPNALLNKVLKDYYSFYKYLNKYHFVILAHQVFNEITPKLTEEEAKLLGHNSSVRAPKDILKTFGLDLTPEDTMFFIEKILGHYGNWFVFNRHIVNDREIIHLRHNFGRTWSVYLFEALEPLIEKSYGKKPKADISEVTVSFEMTISPKLKPLTV